MKEQLKLKKTWTWISIWTGISIFIAFGMYGLTYIPSNNFPDLLSYPELWMIVFGIFLFGYGFIRVDRFKDKYRRKTKQWAGQLPPDIILAANKIRTIPYVSASICVAIGVVADIFFQFVAR